MNTTVGFEKNLIAPCGMNCGTCLAYLREKNRCCGCRNDDPSKPKSCSACIIINCELLAATESKFCYECGKFPCKRLKALDKRYRTRYHVSFIENLMSIKVTGIDAYLKNEDKRWTCPSCGSVLCVHRESCRKCTYTKPGYYAPTGLGL
jgi:hypothetical protein